jgi:hypothetical protein
MPYRETEMNRYEPGTPRAAFAIAALALSALTMALLVAAPASIEGSTTVLATTPAAVAASRIDVVGSRQETLTVADLAAPHVDR